MLKLVIGTAGTGKTTFIINKITQLIAEGEKCLLIVPEQFSKTGEAQLFSSLQNTQLHLVKLFSFSSLLRDVQNNHNKLKGNVLSGAGKAVMAKRAMENVKNQLTAYAKQRGSLDFSCKLSETFDDFKRSGIDSETLYKLALKAPQKNARLKEISLIYAEYCGLISDKFRDSEDLLAILGEELPLVYTHDTHIFVDGFESFSHGQYEILQNMLQNSKGLTVSFAADTLYDETQGTGNFSFTQESIKKLMALAKKCQEPIASPVVLNKPLRFDNEGLLKIDEFLRGIEANESGFDTENIKRNLRKNDENSKNIETEENSQNGQNAGNAENRQNAKNSPNKESKKNSGNIQSIQNAKDSENKPTAFVNEFENQYKEVSFVSAKINSLVKSGYTYNDIAVICPQLEKYENQIQESFTLANIPYFLDQNRIITSSSSVLLFKSILEVMATGLKAQTALPLLKTHLTSFDDEAIDLLENYLYIWQDYTFDFSKPLVFSPRGLETKVSKKDEEELAKINEVRAGLYEICKKLPGPKEEVKGSQLINEAYACALKLGAEEKLTKIINEVKLTDPPASDLIVRQWETVMACFDELYTIVSEEVLAASDVQQLFTLMVKEKKIGFAPQTQDCVMVSNPKRMKLEAVKAAFILGAAQDIFPAIIGDNGVITALDKDYLKENEYPLKSGFENLFSFENLYFYKALTTAQSLLYISCSKKNLDSKQILSAEIENLRSGLNLPCSNNRLYEYAINKEFFTDYLSELANGKNRNSILRILKELDISAKEIPPRQFEIKDLEYLAQILGESITISPTGAENYFQCEFLYFLRNILKLKPLEKVELSSRLAGDYLHFIAQKVMEKYGPDYYKAPWEDIKSNISIAVDSFIEENYPKEIANDAKFAAQHENMRENATQLLQYIYEEQNNSLFRPIAFEEKIGLGGAVPPLVIKAGEKQVNVVGVADRVDLFAGEEHNYLRIVDYKTGTKKFSLDEVYNGLSSQLLLYMGALLQSDFKGLDNLQPAAVVYQPADAAFKFDKDDEGLYTAIGMAISNPEIAAAFDQSKEGRFGLIKGEEKISAALGSTVVGEKMFNIVLQHTQDKIKEMAIGVYGGKFDGDALATNEGFSPCNWCQFSAICQSTDKKHNLEKNNFKEIEKMQTESEEKEVREEKKSKKSKEVKEEKAKGEKEVREEKED